MMSYHHPFFLAGGGWDSLPGKPEWSGWVSKDLSLYPCTLHTKANRGSLAAPIPGGGEG